MNYKDFVMSLKTIKHVYLLTGVESYYIDRGVEDILSRLFKKNEDRSEGLVKIDCDKKADVNEIIAAIETAPFFAEKNVVLVKNITLFKTKAATSEEQSKSSKRKDPTTERLINILSDMLDTNYVIFTTNEPADKRKSLYKTVNKVGIILEAEALRPWQIDNWLNYTLKSLKKNMDTEARKYFIEIISMMPEISLNYLDNELKKTALYVTGTIITKKDLQTIMAEPPEVSSFALIDAVTERNLQKAMYLLTVQINEHKEAPLIALLVRQVRLMIRAKYYMEQGIKGKSLANPLSLNPYIAQKTGEAATKFSDKTLEEVFLMLADADYFFKSGKFGAEMLERIIIKLIKS
ncbi:MAG: DNA polymerase III subunit delta [Selenomonadaceae bacterium]|nr:DNA polymerase III subunit delta [Selenomonadaceae bacterium]